MLCGSVELSILHWIQDHLQCGFMDAVMPWITKLGDSGIFCILLALVLLCVKKTRRTGLSMGIALLLGLLIGNILLKNVVARVRPYDVDLTVTLLVRRLSDFSFPSGHTLAAFETSTVLLIRHRKVGIVATVVAALVAFSRLYLFVHYPTDVLAAIILGIAFGAFGCFLADRIYDAIARRRQKKAEKIEK